MIWSLIKGVAWAVGIWGQTADNKREDRMTFPLFLLVSENKPLGDESS